MSKGFVIVVSGPSGSGKGDVVTLFKELHGNVGVSVSATTRKPRIGEADGVNYYFKTEEQFRSLIENGEVLEYTCYNGNYYGTLKSEAEKIISQNKDLLLEIEVDGGSQIKKIMGDDCILVMLTAPNVKEQERRLRGRGTEPEEVIRSRLERAKAEILEADKYDYIIVNENGKQKESAEKLLSIINAEKMRTARNTDFLENYFR